jgi:hypothetical protein
MADTGTERLTAAAEEAHAAEAEGDTWGVLAAWKRYELIRDANRDPSELLAETVAVSQLTSQLASSRQR